MKTLTLLLIPALISAQTLTLTGPVSASPGSTVTLTLSLAGSAGQAVSGLQWTATPAASSTFTGTAAGAASTAASKALYCGATNATCVTIGLSSTNVVSNAIYSDGIVATFQLAIPGNAPGGSLAVPLSGLFGVSSTGLNVATLSGTPYAILVVNRCDVNSDGVVNGTDVRAVIDGITGRGACPLSACNLQAAIAVLLASMGQACTL
jgi:hypothetical protein